MIDLNTQYAWEMMRKRRLRDTVKEDIAWDILVEAGGATHTIKVQCLTGQTANIDWGDGNSTTATATTLTSYAHDYPAGTFGISITGGVQSFEHGVANGDKARTVVIRSINAPGLQSCARAFFDGINASEIANGCQIAHSVTSLQYWLSSCQISVFPSSLSFPPGVTNLYGAIANLPNLEYLPLSIWPVNGFTGASIDMRNFSYATKSIRNSILPSQILWDSGKTFNTTNKPFPYASRSFLNYAEDYTDPTTGITYSKIPPAWGGAAD